MNKVGFLFQGVNIVGIISLLVGISSLTIAFLNKWPPTLFKEKERFFCELSNEPSLERDNWNVMYRYDNGEKPWLKIITTLGGNWTPQERCNEIAHRLEIYRQDGLTQITYRTDPNTPRQYVICVKTKLSGENCPLLVTLKPDADPYLTLRQMTEALEPESHSLGSAKAGANNSKQTKQTLEPLVINLEEHLADEDRKAGSAAK